MTCPYCKTPNQPNARTCWSCGRALPKETAEPTPVADHPRGGWAGWEHREKPVNTYNDFWMGFWVGVIGMICATIIDKREGFWAAFWGALISGIVYVIAVLLCIYNGVVIGVGVGLGALALVWLFSLAFRFNRVV